MKTFSTRPSDVRREWHVIDASGQPLGRLATQVATYLRGKHKPIYAPHLDVGDFVIVVNASQVRLTGRKLEQKQYYHHSGYPGGLKVRALKDELARRPERVVERAVRGMLPKGPLGLHLFKHLKVYSSANHPHEAQVRAKPTAWTSPPPGSNTPDAPRVLRAVGVARPAPAPKPARARRVAVPPVAVPAMEEQLLPPEPALDLPAAKPELELPAPEAEAASGEVMSAEESEPSAIEETSAEEPEALSGKQMSADEPEAPGAE